MAATTGSLVSSFVVRFGQWEAQSESQRATGFFSRIYFLTPFFRATVGTSFILLLNAIGPSWQDPWSYLDSSNCLSQFPLRVDDALSYCLIEEASSLSTYPLNKGVSLDLSPFTYFKYSLFPVGQWQTSYLILHKLYFKQALLQISKMSIIKNFRNSDMKLKIHTINVS